MTSTAPLSVQRQSWTGDPSHVPIALLGTMALGAGGRLAKNLMDLLRSGPTEASVAPGETTAAEIEQAVPVTPEQARKLQARGVNVKVSQAVDPTYTGSSLAGAIGYGALGGAGLLAGWKGADAIINAIRKRTAKSDVDRVRTRLQRLLDDTPEDGDKALYGTMKMAEELILKEAMSIDHIVHAARWPLAALGGGLVLSGYGSYRNASREAKSRSKLDAVRKFMEGQKAIAPRVRMVPTVLQADLRALAEREKEEEKKRAQLLAPSGSPVQQASDNTALVGV